MAKKVTNKVLEAAKNAGIPTEIANVKLNRPKGKLLSSGSAFWDFQVEPVFTGYCLGTHVVDPNVGRIIGYDFADETGETWVIGAAHAITKSLEKLGYGSDTFNPENKLYIKWLGKTELKDSGRTFNRYEVILLS